MKKYLQFLKYAFKEQRQYKINFFASIGTMIFNDICFIVIFLIFLGYFTGTGLTFGNFLVLFSISAMGYGIIHGLFANIGRLPDIIERGKLDYYLSFPVKPLNFIASTSIGVTDLGDVVFGLICFLIYAFIFVDGPIFIILVKGMTVLILASIVALGLYILVGSISFWLQKGSKIQDLFNSMFVSFSQYPPEIYEENKIVFIFMCILLFPGIILPYRMMLWTTAPWQWAVLILCSIVIPIIGIFVFKRGLKRYSSGNLVHQM